MTRHYAARLATCQSPAQNQRAPADAWRAWAHYRYTLCSSGRRCNCSSVLAGASICRPSLICFRLSGSSMTQVPTSADSTPRSSSLLRSSGLVGLMTMLSRVLGLIRDMVIANLFGAGAGADAFFVAFKIPNFLRRLFAEGAFAQAFVPVLSEYRATRSQAEVKVLLGAVSGGLGFILLLLTLLAVAGAPWITWVFAPGFADDPVKFELASDMLRITFPYLLLISLTAFAGAILNSYDRFAVPAFTPVLLNLAMIGAALWLTPYLS